ncbi:MAG: cyclase family protein [Bacteroidota bacterium]
MTLRFDFREKSYAIDLDSGVDISVPMGSVRCFYAPEVAYTPYQSGDFIGKVTEGAPVNFFNVAFNPHGNGTHTENMGHISAAHEGFNDHLRSFHFVSYLVSCELEKIGADEVITLESLQRRLPDQLPPALLIRTLPNRLEKQQTDYSGTNPPYLSAEAATWLAAEGVEHLLLDLPSVDREVDGGKLAAHKAFWGYPATDRLHCTITELIFVPNEVQDGWYFLNLQTVPFQLDASPSRPVIFPMHLLAPHQ